MAPFDDETRHEIRKRAGNKSELSGRSDRPLECSHIWHQEYNDDPTNGLLATDIEHAAFHIIHKGSAEEINLTEYQNDWSIGAVLKRVFGFSRARGIPDEQTCEEIEQARNIWIERLSNEE